MRVKEERKPRTKIVRKNYGPSDRVMVEFPEETMTKQAFKDECDINNILRRFEKTGQLPDLIKQNPQYGDFSNVPEYQQALNTVQHAQEQFAALSSKIRERFANDPAKFLQFATDPANAPEMVRMGLATQVAPTPSPASPNPPGGPAEG